MKITQVEPQKKNPKRFNIFLDGQFAFGADEDLIVEYRLIPGKQLDNSGLERLLFEAEVGKLIERVYGLLGRRQRSEKEIKDYFKNLSFKRKLKGGEKISDLVIGATLEKLKQKNLINDKEFAKAWVSARRSSKKKGSRALKAELFQKGIDKEIIEEVLEESKDSDESKVAEEALEKKLKSWQNLPHLEKKKKMYNFLLRRGFDYEIVKEVVSKVINS